MLATHCCCQEWRRQKRVRGGDGGEQKRVGASMCVHDTAVDYCCCSCTFRVFKRQKMMSAGLGIVVDPGNRLPPKSFDGRKIYPPCAKLVVPSAKRASFPLALPGVILVGLLRATSSAGWVCMICVGGAGHK